MGPELCIDKLEMPKHNSVNIVDPPEPPGTPVSGEIIINDRKNMSCDENVKNIFYPVSSPVLGESDFIFKVDCIGRPSIKVYQSCLEGLCKCEHLINGEVSQILPCRLACFLRQENMVKISQVEKDFIWTGFTEGFRIVDPDCDTKYDCQNYKSILEKKYYNEMCGIILEELNTTF